MQSAEKQYFLFNKGINTEAPLVQWPEGFSIDEQNFDLLVDGSRRRRPGLANESGSTSFTATGSSSDTSCGFRTYRWADAGHIAGFNMVVAQIGTYLYFWEEPKSGSLGNPDFSIALENYIAGYTDPFTGEVFTNSATDLRNSILSFSQINGKLIVVGEFLEPLMIKYDDSGATPILDVTILQIRERDLYGIEDGIPVTDKPVVLTNTHEYNLWNRGWTAQQIVDFHTSQALYPSKNMISFMGMRRQVSATYSDDDGIKIFSPDKLVAELFQNMSAPQGHMMRDVFNRRNNFTTTLGDTGISHNITDVSVTALGGGQWSATITSADNHGVLLGDEVTLSGTTIKWKKGNGDKIKKTYSGTYIVQQIVSATKFKITIAGNDGWTWVQNVALGTYVEIDSVVGSVYNEDDSAIPCKTRFTCTMSFASRIFFAGAKDERISNRIYFSKVVEQDTDVSICYQEADPTSEFISDLVATDGGYIVLPEAGAIVGLLPFGRSIIVFASNGIWEIGPGREGFFSAIGYSERKISNMGCVSPRSIIDAADIPMYWAEDGIYAIRQDQNSGYSLCQNVTRDVLNGLYNSIRYQQKSRAYAAFDPTRQRVIWLYNSRLQTPVSASPPETGESMVQTTPVTPVGVIDDTDTTDDSFDSALVLDLRLGAWTRWVFGASTSHIVRGVQAMPSSYLTDNENRFKFFVQGIPNSTNYEIDELTNTTDYKDNGAEAEAFVYSGPDSVSDPTKFRSAPYVHIFMRRNENSSIFMQPRWDWSRGHASGKMGEYRQVYRETRQRPETYGVVVTKNKIPGRGRNLFLAIKAGQGAPAWIDGWTIKYDASMRI